MEAPSISHTKVAPFATYSPWNNDAEFYAAYSAIRDNTLVDLYRCYELWSLVKQVANVEGVVLEVGVWRGGTGALLAKATGKVVFLADTFTGVVKAGNKDTRYKGGEHSDTSVDIVIALLKSTNSGAILLEGIFPDETAHLIDSKIAFLHCDVDVYESSKDIVEWTLPRMPSGGIIVFDDYGFQGCEGVTRYCNELRSTPGLVFIHNLNGHAVFVKL